MDDQTKKFSGMGNEASPAETDPALFYRAHVFYCTNRRPAGHPRGCCAEKGAEELRDYMKGRQGFERRARQHRRLPRSLRVGAVHGDLS